MSQMQIFYTKLCNLRQACTRYMWIVAIFEKAVIDSHRKNKTYFGENLQFSLKTEGFLAMEKPSVLVSKQKEIQIIQFD